MRKRGEWPSAERSDARGCGSRIAPTGASEARSRYSGDAASRREWRAKDAGASPCGTVAKPRALSTRRTRPEVPSAVTVGVLPSGPKQGEASCAGLRPEDIYVYGERSQGRANRPPCTGSTVAPTVTAHWKANQHEATTARHRIFHTKRRSDRLEKNWGKGGATDWDRTSNLRLRRPTLYPIELQSRWLGIIPNITVPRCLFFARAPP